MNLKELKLALYRALLSRDATTLTESEVEIVFHLARDADIQEHLERPRNETRA